MPPLPTTIPKVNGTPDLSFAGNDFEFNGRSGFSLNFPYVGPFAKAANFASALIEQRIPFRFRQDGGIATVTVLGNTPVDSGFGSSAPAAVTPTDNWQLTGGEMQKSIYEHPNTATIVNSGKFTYGSGATGQPNGGVATPKDVLAGIKADVQSLSSGSGPVIALTGYTTPTSPILTCSDGTTIAALLNLEYLACNSQDHYAVAAPTLRHTQTVPDYYAPVGSTDGNFNFANCETIYTTTQLLAECSKFPYPLPAAMVQQVKSIPTTSATGFTWGWRKVSPTTHTVADYKLEISTEFIADLWNTAFLYSLSSAPTS